MRRVTTEIYRQGKAVRIKAYLDVIVKANKESLEEVLKMSDAALTLDQIFEDAGLVAKWEARGEARGRKEIARNLLQNGFSREQTAKFSGLDIAQVNTLDS